MGETLIILHTCGGCGFAWWDHPATAPAILFEGRRVAICLSCRVAVNNFRVAHGLAPLTWAGAR